MHAFNGAPDEAIHHRIVAYQCLVADHAKVFAEQVASLPSAYQSSALAVTSVALH